MENKNNLLLLEASAQGNLEICSKLIEGKEADVNFQHPLNKWTALHWASKRGHAEIIRFLISQKADTNLQNSTLDLPVHLAFNASIAQLFPSPSSAATIANADANHNLENEKIDFLPSYLKSPLYSHELSSAIESIQLSSAHNNHHNITLDTPAKTAGKTAAISENSENVEIFVHLETIGELIGSIFTNPNSTVSQLKYEIMNQLDIVSTLDFSLFKIHPEKSLLVPINLKQSQFSISTVLCSADSILIKLANTPPKTTITLQ